MLGKDEEGISKKWAAGAGARRKQTEARNHQRDRHRGFPGVFSIHRVPTQGTRLDFKRRQFTSRIRTVEKSGSCLTNFLCGLRVSAASSTLGRLNHRDAEDSRRPGSTTSNQDNQELIAISAFADVSFLSDILSKLNGHSFLFSERRLRALLKPGRVASGILNLWNVKV